MARRFKALHLMVSEPNVSQSIKDLEVLVGSIKQGSIGGESVVQPRNLHYGVHISWKCK